MMHIVDIRLGNLELVNDNDVVLIDLYECEIHEEFNCVIVDYINQLLETNNSVTIITANGGKEHFNIFPGLNVVNCPEMFFCIARNRMQTFEYRRSIEHHFVCMNNVPKSHRSQLVDDIFGQQLNHFGAVSWRSGKEFAKLDKTRCKHFDVEAPIYIDQHDQQLDQYTQYQLPAQYTNAAVDLVTESVYDMRGNDNVFVTEKTARPLLLGKLFLCLSMPGHHTWLAQQGFELYDDIFDYSFDKERNSFSRYEMYFENVKRICEYTVQDLEQIYVDNAEKIMHNQNLANTIDVHISNNCEISDACKKYFG